MRTHGWSGNPPKTDAEAYERIIDGAAACIDRVGADRLMWGTDMPFQDRFCTYRQSRDLIGRYAPLTEEERAAILGGTAARLLGL